jgi:4-hydroxy-2-oxoglutarate aldolase
MDDRLKGVFAPLTTPFDAAGEVSYSGLEKNMETYAASRLAGYLALGSNGENKSLSVAEKEKVLATIVSRKGKGQAVMAGCIFESTKETIECAKRFEGLGADSLTLLPPSYFAKQMTDQVLLKYFTDVASAVRTPCLVYNAPQFSAGINLSVALVKDLAKHPNIRGMKDSSTGNIEGFLFAVRDQFNVMAGSANFFLSALFMGATGGVISLANAFPPIACELYELAATRQYEKAIALNDKVLRLNKAVSGKGGVAAVKYAMDLAGLAGGDPRLPLLPLKDEDRDGLRKTLEREGMI